jgi:phosphatidylserine/phosphatidylglycerophosphate/cardiolipin synthase-like enzyme
LAATPSVAVRLFNPFLFGRRSSTLRSLAFLADFQRLIQRMHNQLMLADGTVAVVGGRNLADEYFFRYSEANSQRGKVQSDGGNRPAALALPARRADAGRAGYKDLGTHKTARV